MVVTAVVWTCAVTVVAAVVVARARRASLTAAPDPAALERRAQELAAAIAAPGGEGVSMAADTKARVEANTTPELAASLDPDDVLDRVLDAVVSMEGVDAALVVIGEEGPERTTRASGLSDDEIERTLLQMPSHPDLRALEVVYRYRLDDIDETAKLPRAGITVAIRADGETIGSLAAISRTSRDSLSEVALDGIARRAGPAISNAIRFTEARAHAELDSLTGLHNRRLFYEFLGREIARAVRYERFVSLIVFDLDDFKRINDRLGHLGGDAVLSEVADRVRSVVRATDIPCRVGGDEFSVILPESSRDDAELLADRISLAIRAQKIDNVGILKISAGVAELRPEDTAADLFKRADHALYRAKSSGKARVVAS